MGSSGEVIMNKPKLAIAVTSLAASAEEIDRLPGVLQKLSKYFTICSSADLRVDDIFGSQSIENRLEALNTALLNADVVLAFNGGYNSIELFDTFNRIQSQPCAVFAGYSDNTLLANALPATSKSRGFLGPMIATMIRYPEYIDLWARNLLSWLQRDYTSVSADYNALGMSVLQPGIMRGIVIGGNAYTFDLLQGTLYAPKFDQPFIYVLEGEDFITDKKRVWQDTIRNFDSIMLQSGARENLQGLLIGRYPASYKLNQAEFRQSIAKRDYLSTVPIVYDVPRGYAQPSLYLPVGEELIIKVNTDNTITFNGVY